ncbi:uncharacterized protein LOC131889475 [Tigriopus californicus]|uniref:uncharacterized protein LOC131889475 n=1 Tax=Tigriopus californicus TaxID=6832 RepID=UPI0027DA72EC|nr:uncharacterized protein LOC131889475 [Tigriopus californicus]
MMSRRVEILLDIRIIPSEVVYYRWVQVLKESLLIYKGKIQKCLPRTHRHDIRVGIMDPRETSGWRDLIPWAHLNDLGGRDWHRVLERLERKWSGFPCPWIDPHYQPDWRLALNQAQREGVTHLLIWTCDEVDVIDDHTFAGQIKVVVCPISKTSSWSLSQLISSDWTENPLTAEAIRQKMLTFFCREDKIACQLTLPPTTGVSGQSSLVIRGLLQERHLNPLSLPFDMCLSMADVSMKMRAKQSILRLEACRLVKQSGICQSLIMSPRTFVMTGANGSCPNEFATLCQFLAREDTVMLVRSRANPGVFALFPTMGQVLILKALVSRDLLVELPLRAPKVELEANIQVESALNQLSLDLCFDPSVRPRRMSK